MVEKEGEVRVSDSILEEEKVAAAELQDGGRQKEGLGFCVG